MYGKHDLAYLIDSCPRMYITDNTFIKHSKNIIDLIEVGDYVNGYKVEDITIFNDGTFEIVFNEYQWIIATTAIETIVTKEQFAQAEYKIKEDK